MYTNTMRMTGLSGIDTESMVKQLMEAESMRLYSLKKSRQVNVWKQEQYRGVATSLKSYQTSFLSFTSSIANNFKSASNYQNLSSTVKISGTDTLSTAISVTPTDATKTGSYKIGVEQIASKDVWLSENTVTGSIKGSEPFDYRNIKSGDSFTVALDGGRAQKISFSETELADVDSDEDFLTLLNQKLTSAFGTEQVNGETKSKISATINGAGSLEIIAGPGHSASVGNGLRATNKATGANDADIDGLTSVSFDVEIDGVTTPISVEVGEEDNLAKVTAAINKKLSEEKLGVSAKITDGKIEFTNSNAAKGVKISGGNLSNLGFDTAVELDNASIFADLGFPSGASTKFDPKSSISSVFGTNGAISFDINGVTFNFDGTDSVEKLMANINQSSAGVELKYDTLKGSFTMSSANEGAKNAVYITDSTGFLSDAFDFQNISTAKDAIITVNGVSTTRDSNNFTIDGLKIELTSEAVGKEFSIDLKKDTTKSVEFIRKFVEEYNKLVDAVNKPYTTSRPKSDSSSYYEPLTDEEKKALSDKEVEKYEEKAQQGLLYHDSILGGIKNSMRSMLYESVDLGDGTKISLFEIGITTTKDYYDGGKLEIDEDKLIKALEERGDDIAGLFTKTSDISYSNKAQRNDRMKTEGIAERLDDIIKDAISSNGSIYNKAGIEGTSSVTQNDIYKLITDQDKKITAMLATLAKKENNYYMMFSKLEAAMTQANSQMGALEGLLM